MRKFYLFILASMALLFNSCMEEPLIAAFSYESTGLFTITFNNVSMGATQYSWDFGDGETSEEKSPTHVYESAGTYRVILTVKDSKGSSDDVVKNVSVNKPKIYMSGFRIYKIPYTNRYYKVVCYDDDLLSSEWGFGGVYTPILNSSNIPYTQKLQPRIMDKLDGDNYYNVVVYHSKTTSEKTGTLCLEKKLQKTEILKYKDEYIFTDGDTQIGILMEFK